MNRAIVALSGLMLLCQSSFALEASFTPVANNTIYEDNPTYASGLSSNLFAGPIASGAPRRALLKFDLSSLPSNATITAARLSLHIDRAARNSDGTDMAQLHRVLASWGEGTADAGAGGGGSQASAADATWLARFYNAPPGSPSVAWDNPGGDFVAAASVSQPLGLTLGRATFIANQTMLADLQLWLIDASLNHGWILKIAEGQDYKARRFFGRNAAPQDRPRLDISYELPPPVGGPARQIPSLSAGGLFILGLGLSLIARRGFRRRG